MKQFRTAISKVDKIKANLIRKNMCQKTRISKNDAIKTLFVGGGRVHLFLCVCVCG